MELSTIDYDAMASLSKKIRAGGPRHTRAPARQEAEDLASLSSSVHKGHQIMPHQILVVQDKLKHTHVRKAGDGC